MVIENLPRGERFKPENVIVVGCIPGPKEPKGNVNSFLKPLVDELLELWNRVQLKMHSLFGYTSVRCLLSCVSSDLPATHKVCGFTNHLAQRGCSKCLIKFSSGVFGEKLDYSGYERSKWQIRDHQSHLVHVDEVERAKTLTKQRELEKEWGVRYSELFRLPYFDSIV